MYSISWVDETGTQRTQTFQNLNPQEIGLLVGIFLASGAKQIAIGYVNPWKDDGE